MARLPQPGSDQGQWGNILNDFLSTSLQADGTLKNGVVTNGILANGSVSAAKLSTTAAPQTGQVLSWNGSQMSWSTQPSTPNITVVTESQWQSIQPGVNGVLYVVVPN